jgi:hypothetical protein
MKTFKNFSYDLQDKYKNQKFSRIFLYFLLITGICVLSLWLEYKYQHSASFRKFMSTENSYFDDDFTIQGLIGVLALIPTILLILIIFSISKSKLTIWRHFFRDASLALIFSIILFFIIYKILNIVSLYAFIQYVFITLVFTSSFFYTINEFKRWNLIKRNILSINLSKEKIKSINEQLKDVPRFLTKSKYSIWHDLRFTNPIFYLFIEYEKVDYLTYEVNKNSISDIDYDNFSQKYPIFIIDVKRTYTYRLYNNEEKLSDFVCVLDIYLKNKKQDIQYIGKKYYYEKESTTCIFNKYHFAQIDRSIKDFFLNYMTFQITIDEMDCHIDEINDKRKLPEMEINRLINYFENSIKSKCGKYKINCEDKELYKIFDEYICKLVEMEIINLEMSKRFLSYSIPIIKALYSIKDINIFEHGRDLENKEGKLILNNIIGLIKYFDFLETVVRKKEREEEEKKERKMQEEESEKIRKKYNLGIEFEKDNLQF